MTHDELLAKLTPTLTYSPNAGFGAIPILNAMRAVVELHKPYEHEVVSYVFCKECTIDLDLAPPYPCPTIQAIEKELG
jgi:hypothetical protein